MRRVAGGQGKRLTRSRQSLRKRCKVEPWDEDKARSRAALSSPEPDAGRGLHISGLSSASVLSSRNCWLEAAAGCLRPRTWNARGCGGCAMPCAGGELLIGLESSASSYSPVKTASPMTCRRQSLTCAASLTRSSRLSAGIAPGAWAFRAWPHTCAGSRGRALISASPTRSFRGPLRSAQRTTAKAPGPTWPDEPLSRPRGSGGCRAYSGRDQQHFASVLRWRHKSDLCS